MLLIKIKTIEQGALLLTIVSNHHILLFACSFGADA
jgi:hypothetical protein